MLTVFHVLTAYAVHAVVNVERKVRSVWHRVVIRRQTESTVSRLLARVIGDSRQEGIHLVTGHRLLLVLARQ